VRLALGTVQLGMPYGITNQAGKTSHSEAKSMLQLAIASGIDTLDTAIAYGSSETCLGEAGVQSFKLVTKLPVVPDDCGDVSAWIQQQVNLSLLRLGVTALYGLLLHRPDQLLGANGAKIYQALQALKDKGQVQKVGISIYAPSELEALTSRFCFDLVQAPFNLVDQRFYSTDWMQRLKDDDVEVHTRSAFLQGLLLMNQSDIPSKFSQWGGLWNSWHEWLSEQNGLALHACLAFSLSFPEIDRVIVGADTVSQLAEIVSAVNDHPKYDFPNIQCGDENLINPGRWTELR